jgi:hypothetical protein
MYERTTPDYPTFGPEDGTGRSWGDYFSELKGRTAVAEPIAESDDDAPDDLGAVTIIQPAKEIESGWPSVINTWRNRLLANDWHVKVGHSIAHWGDQRYKNGNLKKAEHEEEQYWINAVKGSEYVTISYNVESGKTNSTRTVRRALTVPHSLSDAELRELVTA